MTSRSWWVPTSAFRSPSGLACPIPAVHGHERRRLKLVARVQSGGVSGLDDSLLTAIVAGSAEAIVVMTPDGAITG